MSYEKVKFINFDDFYQNKKILRALYKELYKEEKRLLKRFIYDEINMCESDKDIIWNYLNENDNCRKDLIARYNTLKNRSTRIHNLYEMVDESEKIKEIEQERVNILNI